MIETKALSKIFEIKKSPDITAVQDLTLSIPEGEVFGFLGPNGAGKTTTVRMLTSLIAPTSGEAWVNGFQVGVDDRDIRRSVGILTESPGLYERLSADRNLSIYANLYDVADVEGQVSKYLHLLGLWSRRDDPAGSRSEPKVLFLDEPTSGLDPEAAQLVRNFIETLRGEGRTIFLCTHNLNEADRLCDRIGIFKTHLIEVDTPENLREKFFGRKVVFHLRALDPAWLDQVRKINGVKDVEGVDQKIVVTLDEPEKLDPEIIRLLVKLGADIEFVGELRHSLEEIYIQTMQESQEEETAA